MTTPEADPGSTGGTYLAPSTTMMEFTDQYMVRVDSVPFDGPRLDVTPLLRDPSDFHGDTLVHDVVNFGKAMEPLIGEFADPNGFFENRKELPDRGIIILSDHVAEAGELVAEIDRLAQRVVADPSLYQDVEFCRNYFELAKSGFQLMGRYLPGFPKGGFSGIPVSLERAGLVTTRLAQGLGQDDAVRGEIPIVTKRAHPIAGEAADLMVTVKWRDPEQLTKFGNGVIEIADFVNPASWASTAGLLVAARNRGFTPSMVIHRSIMATEQGIEFATQALRSSGMGNIEPIFYTLGVSRTLTSQYYLSNPAVADAGHVLRHSLPSWYRP